jgi:hypothetical protein
MRKRTRFLDRFVDGVDSSAHIFENDLFDGQTDF